MLEVHTIACLKDNYCYLVHNPTSDTTLLIDATEFHSIDQFLTQKKIKLDFILNTHHHWDHVNGNAELKEKYGCKIFGSVLDVDRIPEMDFGIEPNTPIELGDFFIKTIFLPGHTSHHVAYYFENENLLFTGDTLFSMGCGRLFEGSYEELFNSLKDLASLPEETKIYCGHEYSEKNVRFALEMEPSNENLKKRSDEITQMRARGFATVPTTLKLEKQINPFLRTHMDEIKKNTKTVGLSNLETFTALRKIRDGY